MKPRVVVIDALRLIAVLEMVNGHTLDAVLAGRFRHGAVWAAFSWVRGLISVAFMLAAGLSFHVTTVARFERHRADPAASRHRIFRALQLIAIGYVLRFPFEIFTGDPVLIRDGVARVLGVDVLHVIGFSLLGLELLVLTLRRASHVVYTAGALAVAVIALAPLGEALSETHALPLLTNWVGHAGGSIFPLLPWSAFVLLGVVAGAIALPDGATTLARIYVPRLLGLAALAALVSLALAHSPFSLWHRGLAFASEPSFVVTKLGVVLGAIAVLAVLFARVRALPGPLQSLASETLAMYVFHLVVLYWTGLSVHARIGATLSLGDAFIASAIMIAASVAFGLAWHRQKQVRARWREERARPAPTEEAS